MHAMMTKQIRERERERESRAYYSLSESYHRSVAAPTLPPSAGYSTHFRNLTSNHYHSARQSAALPSRSYCRVVCVGSFEAVRFEMAVPVEMW